MKKRIFFIIPGFRQQVSDRQYSWLVKFIKDSGWTVVSTPVHWNNKTLSENASDFVTFFNYNRAQENRILGFSYGAVIALLTANKLHPDQIYLCSLSPDFREDAKHMSPWLKKYIGKRRQADALTRSGTALAKQLKVPSTIFYGEVEGAEFPFLKKRCEATARNAPNSKLVVVSKASHDISEPQYVKALKRELRNLR